jgi:hypothetical protein
MKLKNGGNYICSCYLLFVYQENENDGGMEAGKTCVGHKGSIALGIYKKACEANHLDPLYFMKLKQRKMQVSEMTKDCRNVNKWR